MNSQLTKSNVNESSNQELLEKVILQNDLAGLSPIEKVILQNDLAGLSPIEKVQHVKNVCESLGLNPLTKPIQLHKFQGKEVMYMSKEGAEQIRKLHNASIVKIETDVLRGDLYIVKAYASLPNGRQDCSTAALSIAGLKGDAVANAMMKAETKAKRRVTLSICGLGMLSEEELDTLPKDNVQHKPTVVEVKQIEEVKIIDFNIDEALLNISQCQTMDELKKLVSSYSVLKSNLGKEIITKIVDAKNKKQEELRQAELTKQITDFVAEMDAHDPNTGEIKD